MMNLIPFANLIPCDANPRTSFSREGIDQLKASILAVKGLLSSLVVVPDERRDGLYRVIIGQRRHKALSELIAEGRLRKNTPVPCIVRDAGETEALLLALTENTIREQMEPIDEYVAMVELVRRGLTIDKIANSFGYDKRTVERRLALGRLVPEAHALIRAGRRKLEWAMALTLADEATQNKICADVLANDGAWQDGAEIRRFLTADAICADTALFDVRREYKGGILYDLWESDQLTDRTEFWKHQNAAIEQLRTQMAGQGVREVRVSHQPFDPLRFAATDDPANSITVIEVAPNGRVSVHKGLVERDPQPAATSPAPAHAAIAPVREDLTGDAIRLTPAVCEYLAGVRTATVQTALSGSLRKCLEITLAGLLGHDEIAIQGLDYRFPGSAELRAAPVFARLQALRSEQDAQLRAAGVDAGEHDNAGLMAALAALPDGDLERLFCLAVSAKVGQPQPKRPDLREDGLLNRIGRDLGLDARDGWQPDEAFFGLMATPDLRRLATELLPADRRRSVATAGKRTLARTLATAFADAQAHSATLDAEHTRRLNEWTPGPLMFPAVSEAERVGAVVEDEVDAFRALVNEAAAENLALAPLATVA